MKIRQIGTFGCCLLMLVATLVVTPAASAQFTVETLLSNSVEQIGPAHKDISDAIEAFRKGDFLTTRQLLEAGKKADPKIPPAGVLLSQMLYAANQPAIGRAELERVVKEDPTDPEAYLLFGEIAFQQRRFSDAELAFTKAAALTKNFNSNPFRKNQLLKRSYSGLAGVAEVREDWGTSVGFLKPIVDANPKDATNTTRMARSLFKQDKAKEAYTLLQGLWEADKTIRRPEITMGLLYQEATNKDMSEKMMKLAADRDKSGLETQLAVSRWAMESGDLALAQTCSDRAVSVAGAEVEPKLVAGLVARYQKDFSRARKALEAAHLQSPANLAAILQLAVVLTEQPGNEKTAFEYAQMARRIYPDMDDATGREAAVTFAWILFRQGRLNEAQQVLQSAVTAGGVSAESSYYAARILHQNNRDVAKKLLESALKSERVFPARADAEQLLKSLN